ncbi:mitochondrial heat shock protein Hsp10 [Dimargaris cristalligena]|uniref:Chaperonin gros n=1 Tax=Dimargaris cristalligena TaxID=215637 RepID=A0A4P9ZZG5_9FUNG|nr:mitochondrial heat shock protein Hsp10 [Dimargaris cristalligena]RKP39133.1 chaperonin gros [Dimargaris cristalligena]|eukprot:RKP39133.1 chaperonin gros [Dimargaris cristalligena]
MSARSGIRKIVPLLDRILVKRIQPEQRTTSGLYIPEKSQEAMQEGNVVAVGPGLITKEGKTIPLQLKEGDRVVLPQFGGATVKLNGEELLLMRENEVLAKIEE